MCLAQGPKRSDAGEARIRSPLVSSAALYHLATALTLFVLILSVPVQQFFSHVGMGLPGLNQY